MKKQIVKLTFTFAALTAGLAHAGPRIDGGGDLTTDSKITSHELAAHLRELPLHLPFVFNYLQSTSSSNVNFESAKAKLYPAKDGASGIFDVLPKAVYLLSKNRACLDRSGTPKAATADVLGPNVICLSESILLETLTQATAFKSLIQLLAHETSHLVGTTEAEAEAVQLMVNTNPQVFLNLPYYIGQLQKRAQIVNESYLRLASAVSSKSSAIEVCLAAQDSLREIKTFQERASLAMHYGLYPVKDSTLLHLTQWSIELKLMNLQGYCLPNQSAKRNADYNDAFRLAAGSELAPSYSFLSAITDGAPKKTLETLHPTLRALQFRYLKFEESQDLSVEMRELKNLMELLNATLATIPPTSR